MLAYLLTAETMLTVILLFFRKLLDNQVALTDDERDKLRQEYEQKSCEMSGESASSFSACSELASIRAQVDRLARKRALRLEAVDKKEEDEIKVTSPQQLITFRIYSKQAELLGIGRKNEITSERKT